MLQKLLSLLFPKKDNVTPILKPEFKNHSVRLETEYNNLINKNKYLYELINDLTLYIKNNLKKSLVITMIYRTDEEQDSIYKDDPKYKIKKFKSPHQFNHAVDLRSKDFTKDEIKQIEDYLNNKYNNNNYYKWTARNHNIGLGDHFHVQLYIINK